MGSKFENHAPSKPLKILTLDGCGLQAIYRLFILNEVLEKIAKQNGVAKPRPCEIFDTIAGIGAGGWLAILLGGFRMDITSCLAEWYSIQTAITPATTLESLRLRMLHSCNVDMGILTEHVDSLSEEYGTGDQLFEPYPETARTRHVIVAGLIADTRKYALFRSYQVPKEAKDPAKIIDGPEKPDKFKTPSAFGVTGAARYYTNPWIEQLAKRRQVSVTIIQARIISPNLR